MSTYSIMIMSHNNEALLLECLTRIKQYTPFEYDLVIVDDASDTPYQIDGATIVRMPKRSNCCNLRNVGMEMAQGEFVFWLDNDTMVGPGWYEPLIEAMEEGVGLSGQGKDGRMQRNPFLPLTQSDCMIEYQQVYDYNHLNNECDFITSYCILVRKGAFHPTHCFGMPTPVLDPDLGAQIKNMGWKVKVSDKEANVSHLGSQTPRPGGREYLHHLAENFTKWWQYWEPNKERIFELYKGIPVVYEHNRFEPTREQSRNTHGDFDIDL